MEDFRAAGGFRGLLSTSLVRYRRDVLEHVEKADHCREVTEGNGKLFLSAFLERFADECKSGLVADLDEWMSQLGGLEALANYPAIVDLCVGALIAVIPPAVMNGEAISYLLGRRRDWLARLVRTNAEPAAHQSTTRQTLVDGLLRLLESYSESVARHSRAVGMLAFRLSLELGLPQTEAEAHRFGGLLIDVGAVTVPQAIFLKNGPLDTSEWDQMRMHAVNGEAILERIPLLSRFAPIVRSHHERYDGHGYPDRLRGDQIPFGARVVSVADAFHAMMSSRPYREPVPFATAVSILCDGRGAQWDPDVVDAFVRMVRPVPAVLDSAGAAGRAS
jgi:HD-GYP domain-containing protein (c-di-GMP phosphodiesterase class II)